MNDKPISAFLGNSDVKEFVIPKFQRSYSWNKVQIAQFLGDFDNVMESDDPAHFFGLIVFVPQNDSNHKIRDIIDGQQRTTTITIVLSILRDWIRDFQKNINLDEEVESEVVEKISMINNCIRNVEKNPKLRTENENEYENEFLHTIISEIIDFDKKKEPRKSYESQEANKKNRFEVKYNFMLDGAGGKKDRRKTKAKNALKNYDLIHSHLKKKMKDFNDIEKLEYLIKTADRITKNFRIIEFEVSSYEKAFEYFEVLNDRGLDVSAIDLIKNNILKSAKTQKATDELFSSWKDIFNDNLDSNYNLIQFMRYAYMCEKGHITAKQIYPSYKDKIDALKDSESVKEFLDEKLYHYATIYKDFNEPKTSSDSHQIHNAIQLIRSTKTSQWYSIGLAALFPIYSKKTKTKKVISSIVDLFEVIHEIMFSLNFVSYVANEIEKEFPKIAKNIQFGENDDSFISSLETAKAELNKFKVQEKLTFSILDFTSKNEDLTQNFYKNNDLGNMFIYFLRYKKNSNNDARICVTSLEHTLPQKPKKPNWILTKLSKDEIREITYSVGNFFNVPGPENTSYGNKSWTEKKQEYINDKVFDVINEKDKLHYSQVKDWNKDIIEKRTKMIRKLWTDSIK